MTGQDILNLVNDRLGGYQNAYDSDVILRFINEGKNEVWAAIKDLQAAYFGTQSQSTDSTLTNFFGPLDPTKRQYTLPADLREITFIECTTKGYEDAIFKFRNITDPQFRNARRSATAAGPNSGGVGTYFYTIQGKDQLILAQYPEAALNLTLFYIKALADIDTGDTIDEIVAPYAEKIADYANKKIRLPLQDEAEFEEWSKVWKEDLLTLATASPRNQSDPVFCQEFNG